tara:strand:- start:727 stop:1098 length:372 start_codon:yes stop_codon:yes gene_type:complete
MFRVGICLLLLLGCESNQDVSKVECGNGTVLDVRLRACIPRLGTGVEINPEGEITGQFSITDLESERAKGFAEGKASVKVIGCGKGTVLDQKNHVCRPVKSRRATKNRRPTKPKPESESMTLW